MKEMMARISDIIGQSTEDGGDIAYMLFELAWNTGFEGVYRGLKEIDADDREELIAEMESWDNGN